MLHLGIMDILQLITYFGSIGIMMLMNKSFPFLVNKILSSFGITTWLGMGVMTLILSINRFITLLDIKFPICIKEIIFYRILLISGYIFTTICLTIMFLPKLGLTINIMWFEFEKDFAQINLMSIFTYIDIGILSAALILYLITVGYLIFNRHFNTSNTRLIAHHELRLFFQAMFICVYKSVVGTMISFWIPSDNLSCTIFYCFALIESGYNPYMYFLTNRALRQEILQMFSLTPKNSNKIHVLAVSYKPAGPRNQSNIDPSIYLHIPSSI
uniref:Uncharacterized protein n=1 Tax=Acrobeloides nanus TaxID=290746 RepID=A0A914DB22_9BILA